MRILHRFATIHNAADRQMTDRAIGKGRPCYSIGGPQNGKRYTLCVNRELNRITWAGYRMSSSWSSHIQNRGVVNGRPQIQHRMWGLRAAGSPLWWWPCFHKQCWKFTCYNDSYSHVNIPKIKSLPEEQILTMLPFNWVPVQQAKHRGCKTDSLAVQHPLCHFQYMYTHEAQVYPNFVVFQL